MSGCALYAVEAAKNTLKEQQRKQAIRKQALTVAKELMALSNSCTEEEEAIKIFLSALGKYLLSRSQKSYSDDLSSKINIALNCKKALATGNIPLLTTTLAKENSPLYPRMYRTLHNFQTYPERRHKATLDALPQTAKVLVDLINQYDTLFFKAPEVKSEENNNNGCLSICSVM